MSDRAQRLGLEPGSVTEHMETSRSVATEREVDHSIAISLKRIADVAEEFIARTRP